MMTQLRMVGQFSRDLTPLRHEFFDFPTHHQFDHFASREFTRGAVTQLLTVPQYDDSIRNLDHFIQPMANVDDADSLFFEFAYDLE